MRTPLTAIIFCGLAAVFLVLALADFRRHGTPATPARKTRFRNGLIFAAVSIYLIFFQGRFQ